MNTLLLTYNIISRERSPPSKLWLSDGSRVPERMPDLFKVICWSIGLIGSNTDSVSAYGKTCTVKKKLNLKTITLFTFMQLVSFSSYHYIWTSDVSETVGCGIEDIIIGLILFSYVIRLCKNVKQNIIEVSLIKLNIYFPS